MLCSLSEKNGKKNPSHAYNQSGEANMRASRSELRKNKKKLLRTHLRMDLAVSIFRLHQIIVFLENIQRQLIFGNSKKKDTQKYTPFQERK